MVTLNKENNYLERKTNSGKSSNAKSPKREWWLVKSATKGTSGLVYLQDLCLPKDMIGKRIKLKLELMEEIKMNNRDRVSEWVEKLPKEFVFDDVRVEPQFENTGLMTELIPRVIKKGYLVTVSFTVPTWEEENE